MLGSDNRAIDKPLTGMSGSLSRHPEHVLKLCQVEGNSDADRLSLVGYRYEIKAASRRRQPAGTSKVASSSDHDEDTLVPSNSNQDEVEHAVHSAITSGSLYTNMSAKG